MTQKELSKPACIACGVATRPLAGESSSGDACFVKTVEDGVLLAAIDGIGHGPQAADAAAAAVAVLEEHCDQPLVELIERCHRALIHKRGVAMTVVCIRSAGHLVEWLGVGNVWGTLFTPEQYRQRWKSLFSQRGIVGYQLPRLQINQAAIEPGDWLVLATDGVRVNFDGGIEVNGAPQQVAERILARHLKGNDDALVLAARYRGNGDE